MKTLALLLALAAGNTAQAETPNVIFAGQLENGEACELSYTNQGETLVTLTAKVGNKTLNFYNESIDETGSLPTKAEGLFDKNYGSIIGAPILWAGRLIEGKLEITPHDGVVHAFELRLRTTVGFGRIPVGSKTYKCR